MSRHRPNTTFLRSPGRFGKRRSRFDPADPKYNPPPDMQVIATLPIGTRLQIGRLMEDNGAWGGVRVTAILEGGSPSQKEVNIDIKLLAKNEFLYDKRTSASTNWGVNPSVLEK